MPNNSAAAPCSVSHRESGETPDETPQRISLVERRRRRRAERERNAQPNDSGPDATESSGNGQGGVGSDERPHQSDDPPSRRFEPGHPDSNPTAATSENPRATTSDSPLFDDLDSPTKSADAPGTGKAIDKGPMLTDREKQQFIIVRPCLVRWAGGGIPGLLLSLMLYWLSPARDGLPRWRPQPDLDWPSWAPGYLRVAEWLGLSVSNRKRAEAQVSRAVGKLLERGYIQSRGFRREPYFDFMAPAVTRVEQRDRHRLWLTFTEKFMEQLKADAYVNDDRNGQPVVKVWRADVSELGANAAIVLGQLWYYCVTRKKKLWIYRYGEKWLAKSHRELGQETGLTVDQVRTAVSKLRSKRRISVKNFCYKGSKTQHFQISESVVESIQRKRAEYREANAADDPEK